MNSMQGSQEDINNAIASLAEKKLIEQIRIIYDDETTTSKLKRKERTQVTNKFIGMCVEELQLPEDRIRNIVDNIIAKAKWIEEIEELDEDLEER